MTAGWWTGPDANLFLFSWTVFFVFQGKDTNNESFCSLSWLFHLTVTFWRGTEVSFQKWTGDHQQEHRTPLFDPYSFRNNASWTWYTRFPFHCYFSFLSETWVEMREWKRETWGFVSKARLLILKMINKKWPPPRAPPTSKKMRRPLFVDRLEYNTSQSLSVCLKVKDDSTTSLLLINFTIPSFNCILCV